MRFLTKPWAIACCCFSLLAAVGVAIAQEATTGDAAQAPEPKNINGGADVNLEPKDMLTKAQAIVPEMELQRGQVTVQLADAKKKRDIVKVLCLDDKGKQMKLAIDTAKDRVVALTSAVSQNDPDRSKHEYTVILVLKGRVFTLVSEAQQCIGEETGFVGASDVSLTIDPGLPDADPSDLPDDEVVSEPPVLTSPTL